MNKPKFQAWDKISNKMCDVWELDLKRNSEEVLLSDDWDGAWANMSDVILMQYSGMHDEHDYSDIYKDDLLEIESPKGKFIAKVVTVYGTFGLEAVKGCIVDYFTDHWNDHFMPLIDLYWNENGDDGCLPKSKRLGSIHENPELLSGVE